MMAYQPFGHTSGPLASSAVALATPIRIFPYSVHREPDVRWRR